MVEPMTWVPSAVLTMPATTAAAEPLLDPPGVRRKSCGLRVPRGSVEANSVVTVFPTMTAPAGVLEPNPAEVAGRAKGGADDLGAQRRAHHAGHDGGGRATARSARGAAQIMRVTRATRLCRGELGRYSLSNNDRPGLAQRR